MVRSLAGLGCFFDYFLSRLLRPPKCSYLFASKILTGRVDVKQFIGHCSQSQLKRMFVRFYPQSSNNLDLGEKFALGCSGEEAFSQRLDTSFTWHD